MNINRAAKLVADKTGWYPIRAFEFEGVVYVMATPLKDYRLGEDVAQCYYPVTGDTVGEPIGVTGILHVSKNIIGIIDAANRAKDVSSYNKEV